MFCKYCGKEIEKDATFCTSCGKIIDGIIDNRDRSGNQGNQSNYDNYGDYRQQGHNPSDSGSVGWAILGFIFPIVGLILWLVWKEDKPSSAKMAGMGALVSVIVGVIFYIIAGASMFAHVLH